MRINPGKVKFKTVIHNTVDFKLNPCGPFLKVPEKFSHSESQKNSNHIITSCIIHIFLTDMNRGFLHTGSLRRIHLSVFRYRLTQNGFAGLKSFQGF